jgi:hypothetical protein
MSQIDKIIAFENGELDSEQTIQLFQELIDSGKVWQLQGFYGRTAKYLIDKGYCEPKAND